MARSLTLQRFLARVPREAANFTNAQLDAIELHFGMRHRIGHAIDFRARIPLPFCKFYIVLLAGRSHRPPE